MANINADEHGVFAKLFCKLQVKEISSKLRVDLPQNIASNREVYAFAKVLVSDTLRDKVEAVADTLEGLVETLISQHD